MSPLPPGFKAKALFFEDAMYWIMASHSSRVRRPSLERVLKLSN
jgi:hypothetical protein